MRPYTPERAKKNRQAKPDIEAYMAKYWLCQHPLCNRESTDPHHIARGPARRLALGDHRNLLALCRAHHDEMDDYSLWPLTRQLAIKFLADGNNFDLEFINEIRGKAPNAIDQSDVAVYLQLKGIEG